MVFWIQKRLPQLGPTTSPDEEQIFFFLYRMSTGEPFEKYKPYLEDFDVNELNTERLHSLLGEVFRNPDHILTKISEGEFSDISFEFSLSHTLSRIKRFALNKSVELVQRAKKILSPGFELDVVGPDGSGKTTAIEDLNELLDEHGIVYERVSGGRFSFQALPLDRIFEVAEKKQTGKEEETSEHARRYSSPIVKLITPFVYYLEYLFRHLQTVRPLRKKSEAVLSDRSFLDVIVSPNTNTPVSKMLYKILPKPSATVYLYNDLDVLDKRRPEHPRHDLERQLEAFDSLSEYYDNNIKTEGREEVSEKLLSIVFSWTGV